MEENNALLNLARTTLLIAYTPLGLILCISRFFLAINACILLSILPEEFIVSRLIRRVTSVVLGMYVKRENFACRVQNTRVFVAYRDTNLAHIVSRIAFPVMILDTKQLIMGWLFGQVSCAESTSLRYEAEKILNKRIERDNGNESSRRILKDPLLPGRMAVFLAPGNPVSVVVLATEPCESYARC